MSKATIFITLVVASGAAALLATDQIAFAQAGSAGGRKRPDHNLIPDHQGRRSAALFILHFGR
jgi:hypothetical protein